MALLSLTQAEVLRLAQAFVEVQPGACTVHKQVSYDGFNYRLDRQAGSCSTSQEDGAAQVILKVMSAEDSVNTAQMEAQNAVMRHVGSHGIHTNTPLEAKDGSGCIVFVTLDGARHAVRMLSYVPGHIMGAGVQSPELQESFGTFLGHVSTALRGFDHPALHHQHDWSMERASDTIRQRAPLVLAFSRQQRQQLLAAADALTAKLDAVQLPCQVCHADANEANVLVNEARTQVVGIIDWGDACVSWRVTEVALAMLYIMLLNVEVQQDQTAAAPTSRQQQSPLPSTSTAGSSTSVPREALQAAGHVLRGFRASLAAGNGTLNDLTNDELVVLPALIRARLALSLVNGAFSAQRAPGNAAYLLQTQRLGWPLLGSLLGMTDADMLEQFLPSRLP